MNGSIRLQHTCTYINSDLNWWLSINDYNVMRRAGAKKAKNNKPVSKICTTVRLSGCVPGWSKVSKCTHGYKDTLYLFDVANNHGRVWELAEGDIGNLLKFGQQLLLYTSLFKRNRTLYMAFGHLFVCLKIFILANLLQWIKRRKKASFLLQGESQTPPDLLVKVTVYASHDTILNETPPHRNTTLNSTTPSNSGPVSEGYQEWDHTCAHVILNQPQIQAEEFEFEWRFTPLASEAIYIQSYNLFSPVMKNS